MIIYIKKEILYTKAKYNVLASSLVQSSIPPVSREVDFLVWWDDNRIRISHSLHILCIVCVLLSPPGYGYGSMFAFMTH